MRVRLHPGAAEDLGAAGDWYESQLPGLGGDLLEELQRALHAVCERPAAWPLWPDLPEEIGVRRFLLARFPFAVAYVVEAEDVVVLAITHVRRRPGYWVGRLPGDR